MFDIWVQAALLLAGALTARAAVNTARTPQGAVGWVVFLLAFPLLALPAYALFGGVTRIGIKPENRHGTHPRASAAAGRLEELGPITLASPQHGNELTLLIDGETTFDAMFAAIDAAETEVCMQTYILRDDKIGQALSDRLIAAAGRGVKVRLLYDFLGTLLVSHRFDARLREHGVEVHRIQSPYPALGRFALNYRNHRKALIVDGCIGFTGGINIGEEYVSGGRRFNSWRDTHLRFEGPMAVQLRHLFAADWEAVTGEALTDLEETPPKDKTDTSSIGLVTGHGPTDATERGSLLLCALAGMAKKRLWIATPYLVPHADLMTALQLAQLRGVDVRFLIPRPSDNVLAWYASRGYAHTQSQYGIDVYEYLPGFMHSKVMLIDDDIAAIGTINFDIRSALLNFEQTALIEDAGFATEVETMLEADFARARRIEGQPTWHIRLLAPLARLFGPLL